MCTIDLQHVGNQLHQNEFSHCEEENFQHTEVHDIENREQNRALWMLCNERFSSTSSFFFFKLQITGNLLLAKVSRAPPNVASFFSISLAQNRSTFFVLNLCRCECASSIRYRACIRLRMCSARNTIPGEDENVSEPGSYVYFLNRYPLPSNRLLNFKYDGEFIYSNLHT